MAIAPPTRRLFTRDEYERAGAAGLFRPDEKLELIAGEVVEKATPQHSRHASGVYLAQEVLRRVFGAGFLVRVQLPLALLDDSEPEPDLSVVRGEARTFVSAHPTSAVLVVEVAGSTLAFDRTTKGALYARARLEEYWIVNLSDRVLEVHREPAPMVDQPLGHHYRSVTRLTDADSAAPLAAPGALVAVSDLLP
jgi:Uma2 family endonuclease